MAKAIIFDLDNTLIDFLRFKKICLEAAADAMRRAGLGMEKKRALSQMYEVYSEDGMEDPLVFQKFLIKALGKVDYRILAKGIIAYRKARAEALQPYPGVRNTLKRLRKMGFRLAIVSDAPRIKAWIRLCMMDIDGLFDAVVAHEDTGRLKPSVKPFRLALKILGVEPSECLMVGDSFSKDIKGARRLGMKTCLARYGVDGAAPKRGFDYAIDRFGGILKIV